MKTKTKIIIYAISGGCAISLGIFFRLYPLIHQGESDARQLATIVVYNHLKQEVQQYIDLNFSPLTDIQKTKLADENFSKLAKENQKNIQQMINDGTKKILQSRPKDTPPFLLEADSYHFYGLTENIKELGSISKNIKHGKYFDPLMLAPTGKWEPISLHPYLGFYLYKLISFFNKNALLISSIMFAVIIIAVICVIPFLLILYEMGVSPFVAFVGSIFFILSPFFTQRTAYGWYDTDVYNVLFPLLILASIFYGLNPSNRLKKNIVYAISASFLTGLYELFYHGWSFIFVVLFASLPFILIIDKILNRRNSRTKPILIYFGTYFLSTFFWVSVLVSPFTFIYTFQEGWKMLNSFTAAKFDLWPNIFLTVGETQPMSFNKISFLLGGSVYFIYFALFGLALSFIAYLAQRNEKNLYINVVISIFSLVFLYLSLKAVRFAILLTVPISLAFALFLEHAYHSLANLNIKLIGRRYLKTSKFLMFMLTFILLGSVALPIYSAHQIASRIYPVYNKTWERVLLKIKKETPENSIINTWWCPGHFITAVAKRRVIIDGASQQEPQTYWMATILLSQDEKTALGLLRMLDLSGNAALDYLQSDCGLAISIATDILKEIAPLNRAEAKKLLISKNIKENDAENILRLTHDSTPVSSYLLNYNELIDTYLTFPFIANWDFKKAEFLVSTTKGDNQTIKIPSRGQKGYLDFLWSISGGIPPCSPQFQEVYRNENIVLFENRFVLERKNMDCFLLSEDGTKFARPKSLFFIKDGEFKEKDFLEPAIPFSVLLIENNNVFQCILLDGSLAKSLLFRLYYLKGKGLSYFKPFIDEEDALTKTHILVYKIDWDLAKSLR